MKTWQQLVLIIGLLCAPIVQSMTVEVHGNKVFATGPVEDDLLKFEEAFAKPGVDTVVFVNSPGGDGWTALRVGRLIADRGYKTVIAGSCMSACSIMFMGGKTRQFSDALRPNQTVIGIHGAHNKDTKQINPLQQPQFFAFYKQYMGERFNPTVMNQALYDMEDAGSFLRVFDSRSKAVAPYHCKSSQSLRSTCSKHEGQTALSLGIVTDEALAKIELPAKFRPSNAIFGRELTQETSDVAAFLSDIALQKCPVTACATQVAQLAQRPENRAIAIAAQTKGVGLEHNADTMAIAVNRAIFNCNHARDVTPRLCEARLVNGYDLGGLYAESDAAHPQALSNIKLPSDKYYANEEFGGNFVQATGLRIEKLGDITPRSVDGIQTLHTQDLAQRLIKSSAEPMHVIDVSGFFQTIPSAKTLLGGGLAFSDKVGDERYEKRFLGLMEALVPNKTQPVVFFCSGRNCWTSLNAAMRAKKLGYTQVLWYRGGLEAWLAAGLPTAQNVIRAVVN
jgi:rhodanese-related sulfurtransferase